jgi:hypothetical protein
LKRPHTTLKKTSIPLIMSLKTLVIFEKATDFLIKPTFI